MSKSVILKIEILKFSMIQAKSIGKNENRLRIISLVVTIYHNGRGNRKD